MKLSDKFMISSVGGEDVVLPIDNECVDYNSVFMLGGSGMFILSSLPATYDELLDKIVDEYDIGREDARVHLDKFLGEVKKYGIIE